MLSRSQVTFFKQKYWNSFSAAAVYMFSWERMLVNKNN